MRTAFQLAETGEPSGTRRDGECAFLRDGLGTIAVHVLVIPVGIVFLAMAAMRYGAHSHWSLCPSVAVYAIFVLLIAALSWSVGHGPRSVWLRWLVLGWGVLLIDIVVYATSQLAAEAAYGLRMGGLSFSLLSAQAGLLAVWAVLGTGAWQYRVPLTLVGLALILLLCGIMSPAPWSWQYDGWTSLLSLQVVGTTGLCLVFWLFGYSIDRVNGQSSATRRLRLGERLRIHFLRLVARPRPGSPKGRGPDGHTPVAAGTLRQFTLGQMLWWMTAFAGVLGVLHSASLFHRGFAHLVLIAALTSLSLVAVWGSLGQGRIALRVFVLIFISTAIGIGVGIGDIANFWGKHLMCGYWDLAVYWPTSSWEWEIFTGGLVSWVSWSVLATAFLAGLLGMFRVAGYRLVRHAAVDDCWG